ncbi:MAG TPA: ABC transporter permease [Polyangia bacterium]|nr:ABC transporter permease [Polyangia bacterium]
MALAEYAEAFVAWRYLYRRRHSRAVMIVTLVALLSLIATQVAFFAFGQAQVGAILTIPTALVFVVFLLLNFFSVFTTVSIIGVILGVAALTVVLSVTSGFQQSFQQKVLGVNAHILVLKYGQDFTEYRSVMEKAASEPHVKAVAPFLFNPMMISRGPQTSGLVVKGIDTKLSPGVLDIADKLTDGKMADLDVALAPSDGGAPLPAIFLGKELAKKLKAKIGDRVRVLAPKSELDPKEWTPDGLGKGNQPTLREFRVAGIFYSGFDEYDRRLAYVTLKEAQAFYPLGDTVTGVEMKLDDVDAAADVAHRLESDLGGTPFKVIDWEYLNHNLFTALRMQKVALVIFLTLIILVAAFNIVAAMTMLVVDKTKEIAILKSMGMRAAAIARVFQIAGLTIGAAGTAAGLALGVLLCAVVERYGYKLDAQVYLIDRLPVQVNPLELVLTAGITLAICFLATVYPSLKAAWLEPVEGLRYE